MSDNPLDILEMLPGDSAFLRHNWHVYATTAREIISVAGNVNVTLTETQAAHYQIAFTGALTGNVVVFVPQKEKPYVFVNTTTGAFSLTVQPVTSGTGLVLQRGMYHPITCDGVNMVRQNPGNATTPEGLFHTIQANGVRNEHYHDTYMESVLGTHFVGRHARGTQLNPEALQDEDRGASFSGYGWGRNAADSANEWIPLGLVRIGVDSVDGDGRLGGWIDLVVSPGGSDALIARLRVTEDGRLLLGNPVTGNDKIALSTGDRDGVAGKHSLTIATEDGTEHLFGDIARFMKLPDGQSLDFGTLTELTTIAAAAFTDTTFQIPAEAVVFGASVYVDVAIPTATTFSYGVAGATTRYGSGISTAITTAHPGASDLPRHYPTLTKIRITPNATPATNVGRVRVTVPYYRIVPPSS